MRSMNSFSYSLFDTGLVELALCQVAKKRQNGENVKSYKGLIIVFDMG
jgi:hypothetical protein